MKLLKEKINRKKHKWCTTSAALVHDHRLSADARILYQILYTSAKNFEPSVPSLAQQFGVTPLTIKRWFAELREFGYITSNGDNYHKIHYLHVLGIKNDTKKKENMVSEKIPNMVSEMTPIINTITDVDKSTSEIESERLTLEEKTTSEDVAFSTKAQGEKPKVWRNGLGNVIS